MISMIQFFLIDLKQQIVYTLREIDIPELSNYSTYFDGCRSKRNITDYDRAGEITEREAEELFAETSAFLNAVKTWLRHHHPDLS